MTTQTTPAGAMPVAAGATPVQTPPPGGTPPPAEPPTPAAPATGTTDGGTEPLGEPGLKALEDERRSRRDAEKRASSAEDELKKLREASLTEAEKREQRLTDLERAEADWKRERQELRLSRDVERAAAKAGFIDPGDAWRLIDISSVEFDAEETAQNVDTLVSDLAKAKPHLISAGQPPPPPRPAGSFDTGLSGGPPGSRTYSREELRDPAFFAANREDILAAQREGRVTG